MQKHAARFVTDNYNYETGSMTGILGKIFFSYSVRLFRGKRIKITFEKSYMANDLRILIHMTGIRLPIYVAFFTLFYIGLSFFVLMYFYVVHVKFIYFKLLG